MVLQPLRNEVLSGLNAVGYDEDFACDIVEIYVSRYAFAQMSDDEDWWKPVLYSIRRTERKPVRLCVPVLSLRGNEFDPSMCEIDSVIESADGQQQA